MVNTVEQDNEVARAAKLTEIRDRMRIFHEVLDNPRGRMVIDYIAKNFQTQSGYPPNQLDDHGRTDALQTWRKLGHFDVVRFIKDQLESKEIEHVHPRSGST